MSFAQSSTATPQQLMQIWRSQDSDTPYFINFQNSLKYPREEAFTDMIIYSCLPTYKFSSMTTILITLNTIYFIILLLYGNIKFGGTFLEPNQNSLYSLGMLYPYNVKYEQEYQRLFLSLLLFCNFINFISCQLAIAIYGSYVEKLLGWKKLWIIGLLGGFFGTIVSCCYSSGSHINGISIPTTFCGVLLGYTIIKWDKWSYSGSGRYQMLSVLLFGLAIFIWQTQIWIMLDLFGLFCSFLFGILIAFFFAKQLLKNDYDSDVKCIQIAAGFLLFVLLLSSISFFIWIAKPQRLDV